MAPLFGALHADSVLALRILWSAMILVSNRMCCASTIPFPSEPPARYRGFGSSINCPWICAQLIVDFHQILPTEGRWLQMTSPAVWPGIDEFGHPPSCNTLYQFEIVSLETHGSGLSDEIQPKQNGCHTVTILNIAINAAQWP